MEIVKIRYQEIVKALKRLQFALKRLEEERSNREYDLIRDSVIQRFEFCTDTLRMKLVAEFLLIMKQ